MGRIKVQIVLALFAIAAVLGAMGYVTYNVITVTVPDYGGTLVEGIAGNPYAVNPILCQGNPVDQDIASLVFTGLMRIDEHSEIVPDLAERWELSSDGLVYTFYLRQDVVWHDGAPFTSRDVIYTVSVMQDTDYQGASYLADMWRTVVVEATDDYTVRFQLREPFAPFLDYTVIGLLPAHILGSVSVDALAESQYSGTPVGTGPFRVMELSVQRAILTVNADFYRPRPFIDRIEFLFYPNEQALFAARSRGEIMSIARVLPEHLAQVERDEDLTLYSAALSGYNVVFLNLDRGFFQDSAVRQSLMWAIDRQQIVDDLAAGQGIVLDSPVLPYSWAYFTDVFHYGYDPKLAVETLERADWYDRDNDGVRERGPFRLEFTLATNEDDPTRVAIAQAISEQVAEIGVKVNLEFVSWDELIGQRLRLRRYDAVLSGWQDLPFDPDPYPFWHSSQATEEGLNFANYISERADYMLENARSTSDREQRQQMYWQFQDLFSSDVPSLLLYQPVYSYAVDTTVKDVQVGHMIYSSDRFLTVCDWYIATQRMLYNEAREKGLKPEPL